MRVLITGATRGIGAGLAQHYRDQGDSVMGTGRIGGDGPRLDVTDPESHSALAAAVGDVPIDLLVCNAGVYLDKGHAMESGYSASLWAETLAVNVTGVFLTVQALLPNIRRSTAPKIAVISSKMGSHTLAPGGSYIYRASKAAVLNVGRNLAAELKPDGIAVGIYHPGWVRTDMGGPQAAVSLDESVAGLASRFDALSLENTGCFEAWDGETLPL
ncbi:MAG: SDR family oxidoreductase [Pseudomonadota bacterium]